MTEQEMIIALKYYVELVKQLLPAIDGEGRKIVKEFNESVEKKLQTPKT